MEGLDSPKDSCLIDLFQIWYGWFFSIIVNIILISVVYSMHRTYLYIYIFTVHNIYITSFPNITTSLFFHPLSLIFFLQKNIRTNSWFNPCWMGTLPRKFLRRLHRIPLLWKRRSSRRSKGIPWHWQVSCVQGALAIRCMKGMKKLPTCIGIIISHEIRIPINQSVQWNVIRVLNVAQVSILNKGHGTSIGWLLEYAGDEVLPSYVGDYNKPL